MMIRLAMVGLCLLVTSGAQAGDKPSCEDETFAWSDTQPALNLRHILCGEIKKNGDVVGMHSRVIQETAPVKEIQAQPAGPDGLYGATVYFENGKSKNSTFFPDSCTVEQLTNSILYAVRHSHGPAKPWGKLGCSAPAKADPKYCTGPDGARIVIRFGELDDGRVNTAFPLIGESCPS